MTAPMHDRVLKVADLVDAPGASRPVELDVAAPEGFDVPLVTVREPLRLRGVLESVVDGLLLRGTLEAEVEVSCARCLGPVTDTVRAEVVELFSDPERTPPEDLEDVDEGYEIVDGQIDLDALLRDALAPALPARPLCREDCRGICADCGADRNEGDCGCAEDRSDPRWAALEGLRLTDSGDDTPPEPA
jgi:uncharacterized protein